MATTTKPYKLFHVPTHRVGVYLRQPGTQRHARIRNTGGMTTTTKYLNTGLARSMATTTKPYKLFHVPTHRVGVYLRQPGTQHHARIRNTGGVTTTTKYLNTGLTRSMATTTKPYKLFHVPTHREVCTCANQGPNVTHGSGTLGV